MVSEELKTLEKAVKKAKRIALERAGELHDLVEERLPAAFEELPQRSEACYQACAEWQAAQQRLKEAGGRGSG